MNHSIEPLFEEYCDKILVYLYEKGDKQTAAQLYADLKIPERVQPLAASYLQKCGHINVLTTQATEYCKITVNGSLFAIQSSHAAERRNRELSADLLESQARNARWQNELAQSLIKTNDATQATNRTTTATNENIAAATKVILANSEAMLLAGSGALQSGKTIKTLLYVVMIIGIAAGVAAAIAPFAYTAPQNEAANRQIIQLTQSVDLQSQLMRLKTAQQVRPVVADTVKPPVVDTVKR